MELAKILARVSDKYSAGKYEEAISLINETLNSGEDSKLYVELGNCYYKQHNTQGAVKAWERAISLDPKESFAYANLGNYYYAQKKVEKAISMWTVALISRPEDSVTSLNLAVAFNEKGMRFEAIRYFEKYLKYETDKNSEEYKRVKNTIQNCFQVANECLQIGAKLHSENNPKQAGEYYFKALANYPNLSKVNLNLGSIFFGDKNFDLAIKYWLTALHIEPDYEKIYSNLAVAYDMKRQFDYAYCYYYKYMNFLINNKQEYYKANQRLLKIKPYINKNEYLIDEHLKKAEEYIKNCQFYDAIDEYKNYSILRPEEKDKYKELILKLETYLNPEKEIIKNCFNVGNELINSKQYGEAQVYFVRIMRLSSPQSLDYTKARA
ncbi:tetratricopeptide repeat protein, partial [bacterium]|nr:tetratricopeptide repeat protein [bacterium]